MLADSGRASGARRGQAGVDVRRRGDTARRQQERHLHVVARSLCRRAPDDVRTPVWHVETVTRPGHAGNHPSAPARISSATASPTPAARSPGRSARRGRKASASHCRGIRAALCADARSSFRRARWATSSEPRINGAIARETVAACRAGAPSAPQQEQRRRCSGDLERHAEPRREVYLRASEELDSDGNQKDGQGDLSGCSPHR